MGFNNRGLDTEEGWLKGREEGNKGVKQGGGDSCEEESGEQGVEKESQVQE